MDDTDSGASGFTPPQSEPSPERMAELDANLAAVRREVADAASAVGRDPGDVDLLVVTKTWPTADVIALSRLGVACVGENRVQELAAKRLAAGGEARGVRWHLIGALQTNKAAAAARCADVIESVDRERLVVALERAARRLGRTVACMVQVSLDAAGTVGRSGVRPESAAALANRIASSRDLQLVGVMGIAPQDGDARAAFERLAEVAAVTRRDHPGARTISAGMSSDFRDAIGAGATQVRIGTAVLGHREYLR